MNTISLQEGRINQKFKTRTRILNAAKSLLSKNKPISLEEVAHKAQVSRATIYRYFTNIDLLCTEASLDIHHLSPAELSEKVSGMTLDKRIYFIQNYYNQLAQDHELIFRRYISATLLESRGSKKKVRGARRLDTLNLALQPVKAQLTKKDLERLKNISSILMGIDSLIVAKDVCGLSNEETNETLKWGLEMILKGIASKTKLHKK